MASPSIGTKSLSDCIVGTWTLASWTRFVGGVEEPGLLGRDAVGHLLYSRDGYMSAHLMRRGRARFATEDVAGPADPLERAAAYDGYQGYCGRYEVDEDGSFVLHRVALSSNPNWTDSVQKRFIQFAGDRMKLTTPPILRRGKEATVVLIWERAS
jgi:lipocalin-like protein